MLAHLADNYKTDRLSEQDNLLILNIINEPQVYTILQLLRTAIVTKNDLEKLRKKGVDDIDKVLKALWDAQMIQGFQDASNNEYYALLSDIYLISTFPKYLLNTIKLDYDNKSKADPVLIEYINILENAYLEAKS